MNEQELKNFITPYLHKIMDIFQEMQISHVKDFNFIRGHEIYLDLALMVGMNIFNKVIINCNSLNKEEKKDILNIFIEHLRDELNTLILSSESIH